LIVTGVAYVTYFKAMEVVEATQASRIFFLKPVVATLFAVLSLGETISIVKIIGIATVLFSLTL
jgi:drug/metabolite transporter (DMT)-like permease